MFASYPIASLPLAALGDQSNYTYDCSGSLQLGNQANCIISINYKSSGNLLLTGQTSSEFVRAYEASGNLTLGGQSTVFTSYTHQSSGKLTLGGQAPTSLSLTYQSAGSLRLGNEFEKNLTHSCQASGNLSLIGQTTCVFSIGHNPSGSLSLGGQALTKLSLFYEASGSLRLGNQSETRLTHYCEASGNLSLSGQITCVVHVDYQSSGNLFLGGQAGVIFGSYQHVASGSLSLGNSAGVRADYSQQASGGLSLGGGFVYGQVYDHAASGGLSFGNRADVSFAIPHVCSGGLRLSGSAGLFTSYAYSAGGALRFGGNAGVFVPQGEYSYEGQGLLGTLGGKLERPFDIRMLPHTGYWDLIEDQISSAVQKRLLCNENLGKVAFLGALKNDAVREMIGLSGSWRVVCYLGDGVYDIEIDGRRLEVDTDIEHIQELIEDVSINVVDVDHFWKKEPTQEADKAAILGRLNERTREMLASVSWTARYSADGTINIRIGGSLEISVSRQGGSNSYIPELPADARGLSHERVSRNVVPVPKEVVLSRLKLNSRIRRVLNSPDIDDWSAEFRDGVVAITATKGGRTVVAFSVDLNNQVLDMSAPSASNASRPSARYAEARRTLSKDYVASLNSFLGGISRSGWEVLGVRGSEADVRLENGLIFSVTLR